ncbi:MAG: M4 family metallopeptidase, partial [Bacteroidota bacterium]
NVNAARDEVATDCHWAAEMYYDYLLTLGRNSIDGNGEVLESHVHNDVNWANAAWDGRRSFYGDGNLGSGLELPTVTIDIVAHEFTHGLTDRTSNLIYQQEFGALNESFSDIFGVATSFWARPEKASWIVGAEATLDGQGIRNMQNPNIFADPKTYRGDFWVDGAGVHTNSGPQNHWFYLLVEGGTGTNELGYAYEIEGLGLQRAIEVAYRNNSFYLTETSEYDDAAFNGILATASVFGSCSNEVQQVAEAWRAIGVDVEVPELAIAAFRTEGPFCAIGDSVQFINNSFGNGYFWDFGDGTTSTEQNPVHVYNTPGAYDVSLLVSGCDNDTDLISIPSAVIIDPDNIFCSFDTMPVADTLTIVNCRGVLYDSGGPNGRYQNREASLLTIQNPNGEPITLTFNRFRTELFTDRMFIYDGDNPDAPELAVLSGNVQRDPIVTTGPSVTFRWSSDGGGTDNGWEIVWGNNQSNSAPDASFVADNTNPRLNEPVIFSANTDLPGPLTYDFGDGTPPVFGDGPITHAFSQPGDYLVTAIDANCTSADTATVMVSVQVGTTMEISPAAIIDTLIVGDT